MKLYGVYSVMGNFGSGKTFGTFLEVSHLDKDKNFIIANVPYKFVDLFFSEPRELYKIIESLEAWIYGTNEDVENYFYNMAKYKNIVIVVDEAHLYFNARKRDKGGLMERLDVILTQCRKRNIKIFFISQRLKRVDLNIRRMTDYVVRYKRQGIPILGVQRSIRTVYENEGDLADIQGDEGKTYVMNSEQKGPKTDIEKSVMESSMFRPLFKVFWIPVGKRLSKREFKNFEGEAHNSYFISGLPSEATQDTIPLSDLYARDRELSDRELKIRNWIHKNLPTFVKLLKPKQNNNGNNSGEPIASDQGSNLGDVAYNGQSSNLYLDDGLREEDLGDNADYNYPTKRIDGFRKLKGLEDGVLGLGTGDNNNSSSSNGASRIRIKKAS